MVEFTDKELADRVVALGVGRCTSSGYYNLSWDGDVGAHIFVRDWRVAGALMEMMGDELLIWKIKYEDEDLEGGELISLQTGHAWVVEPSKLSAATQNESLPRAIIEACCEALDG